MKTKMKIKASKIYARIGFEDITVPIDNMEALIEEVPPQYFIGYEDEDGEECEEDGTYYPNLALNQNNNNIIEFYCEKYSNDAELGKAIRKFKYKQ